MTRTRITTDGITDASVTTQKINDSAVTTGKIANAAVTDAKIADVAAAKITGQIATSQVADGAITDAKITSAGLATSSLNWSAIQPWAANTSYAKGALVEFQGIAYRRSVAGTSGASFNSANWQQLTPSTYPNTLITGLGTMATATAADYLARAGGSSNAMTGPLVVPSVATGTNVRHTSGGGLEISDVGVLVRDSTGVGLFQVVNSNLLSAIDQAGMYPHFACRAWVNFDGTRNASGAASTANTTRFIRGSGNVASVMRNGIGDYTITFTTAMPDANYSYSHSYSNEVNVQHTVGFLSGMSASSLSVRHHNTANSANTSDKSSVLIAIFR